MNENNNIQQENISRVLLVGVNVDDNPDFETSMEELESLAEACEMEVAAKIEQNLSSLNPAYYIGSGKVKEVQETVEQMDLDYVIFDETLSPSQLKNLQKEVGVPHNGSDQSDFGDFFPESQNPGGKAAGRVSQSPIHAASSCGHEGSPWTAGRSQRKHE